ncbi:MAG TPA: type IV pilus biogenesis/stability protein PilW [Burkholderiales bacterium]|nr:type IV pilus biogenesis/stability protein PilW [Burkholderiales bacterium]
MKKILLLGLAAMLAGCVQERVQTTSTSPLEAPPAKQADAKRRAQIHTELGSGYYERGQLGVALEELKEALRADSDYAQAYNVLGLVYMELREDADAERNFRQALKLAPLDSDTNNNYGWFLCQRKREQESIKYFLAALKNPLYATPEKSYANAGICARRNSDEAAAEAYFLKALRLRPDQQPALYNMADLKFKRGQHGEAKSYLVKYMQVTSVPTPESLWLGVRIERKLGDSNAEASYAAQLRKRYPDSRETRTLNYGQFE